MTHCKWHNFNNSKPDDFCLSLPEGGVTNLSYKNILEIEIYKP